MNYNPRHIKINDANDELFVKWLKNVNRIVYTKIKYNLDDLQDELYRDNFDNNMTPEQMSKIVIDNFISEVKFIFTNNTAL